MDRFDVQTLVQSGSDGMTFVMSFEDATGKRFTLTAPTQVALALIPILEKLRASTQAVGAYAIRAEEWQTARDQDSPNVFLVVKGHDPFVFSLKGAKALAQQFQKHCEEIESRGATKVQ
jgi:hypothetical protein